MFIVYSVPSFARHNLVGKERSNNSYLHIKSYHYHLLPVNNIFACRYAKLSKQYHYFSICTLQNAKSLEISSSKYFFIRVYSTAESKQQMEFIQVDKHLLHSEASEWLLNNPYDKLLLHKRILLLIQLQSQS